MLNHFRHKGPLLGALLGALGLLAGGATALAAEHELRLPVEKSVRLAPPPETPAAKPEKKAASEAVKPEAARPEAAKPDVKKPEAKKAEAPKPEMKKAEPEAKPAPAAKVAAKAPAAAPPTLTAKSDAAAQKAQATAPAPKPAPEPKPAPAPAPKPAPKPKPEPKVDPLALLIPAQQAHEAVALPEGGTFVGDVMLEFQAERLILRVTTSGPVERLTHFGLTDPSGPRKLALDLRGPWRKKGPGVLRFDSGPVKAVVLGEHPDRLRLAVEFREGAVAQDMQPTVELGPKGCTATIPLAVRLKQQNP